MDLNSKTWRQIPPPDSSETLWPSPRFFSSATVALAEYTRSGNPELWIFGGENGVSNFDELWVLDLETYIWTLEAGGESGGGIGDGNAPKARSAMNAASRWGKKLVVYGGSSSVFSAIPVELSDTWAYDFEGGGWELLNGGTGDMSSPGKRTYHISSVMTVNGHDALIVYGGYHQGGILSDIWSLDLSLRSWSQLSWSPDTSRMRHSVVTEESKIWTYGGFSQYSSDPSITQSTISNRVITTDFSDLNSNIWYEPTNTINSVPGARYDHTADVWRGSMIIYGGSFQNGLKATNMWSFDVQGADLTVVTSEDDFTAPPTFSLLHVLIALGIMMCCMCVFMRIVRSRLNAHPVDSMGTDNLSSSGPDASGLSSEELLRLPPLKRFRTLDTETGTYSMEIVHSLSRSSLKDPNFSQKAIESAESIQDDPGKCCAICIDNFGNGDIVRELPCKHEFHASCVDEWLQTTPLCPMCKRSMREATASPRNQSEGGGGNDGLEEHDLRGGTAVEGGGSLSAIELGQAGSTTTRRRARRMGGLSRFTTCPFLRNNIQAEAVIPRPSEQQPSPMLPLVV